MNIAPNAALIVIDVQQAFDDAGYWGERNNPDAESHIESLIEAWERTERPVVQVKHDSTTAGSPLSPVQPGNAIKPSAEVREPALLVSKSVNSAFLGTPDLGEWLVEQGIAQIVIVGIQTNMCCETTARMGGNLGFDVLFVADATHTFDLEGPDGVVISADDLARVTAANLHGEFATVVSTAEVLAAV